MESCVRLTAGVVATQMANARFATVCGRGDTATDYRHDKSRAGLLQLANIAELGACDKNATERRKTDRAI